MAAVLRNLAPEAISAHRRSNRASVPERIDRLADSSRAGL